MKLNKKLLPLSVAAAMAALTACQVGVPTNTAGIGTESTVGNNNGANVLKPGQVGTTTGNGVQTNPVLANPNTPANATINGRLLDMNGKPIAGATVTTLNGTKTVTDAQGNYTIRVGAETGKEVVLIFQKEGFIYSSDRVMLNPNDTASLTSDLKQMDPKVNMITTAGGTFANSTGVLEIDVPKGAMTGNVQMQLTPLSFGGDGKKSELPGPLETVDETGTRQLLMPVEYWSIDMAGGTLKPGESMTMRMKLPDNPYAPVKLKAGDMIPCYIFDAQQGFWNSPNLGPIVEKDGVLWATYEIKASALTDRVNPTAKKIAQVYTDCAAKYASTGQSCTEQEIVDNSIVERAGAGNVLQGSIVQGISGGHTYYNLYGSRIKGHAYDFDGVTPLNGVSVQVSGGAANGAMTTGANGVPGEYSILEYRNHYVTVTASAPSLNLATQTKPSVYTENNLIPLPTNQFGRTIQFQTTVSVTRNSNSDIDTVGGDVVSQLLDVWTSGPTTARTPKPTPTPTPTPVPTKTPKPSAAPTDAPVESPSPSADPSAAPTATPTPTPSGSAGAYRLLSDYHFSKANGGKVVEGRKVAGTNFDNASEVNLLANNQISWEARNTGLRRPSDGSTYQMTYLFPPADLRVQGRQPESIGDYDFIYDTRHPLTFQLSGVEAVSKLAKVTVKLDGVEMLVNDGRPAAGYLPLTGPNATGAGVTVNDAARTIATSTGVATRGNHKVSIQIGDEYFTEQSFSIPASQPWTTRVNVPIKMFSMGAK